MIFYIGRNPFIRFQTYLENKINEHRTKIWRSKPHKCICHVCGQVLDSRDVRFCPEECGWIRLRGNWPNPYICHQCLEHHKEHWVKKEDR